MLEFRWNLAQKSSIKRGSCVNLRKNAHIDYFSYFSPFWKCLCNFDQGNLSSVSKKAHGCDSWIFIFASMHYDTLNSFWVWRKPFMPLEKVCLLLSYGFSLEYPLGGAWWHKDRHCGTILRVQVCGLLPHLHTWESCNKA